jgi:hypothetical protein
MCGSSSPPPPPDYTKSAEATAAGSLEAARAAAMANRVNQYTPYGSQVYSRLPEGFDQSGYDKAMANYNQSVALAGSPTATSSTAGSWVPNPNYTGDASPPMMWQEDPSAGVTRTTLTAPNRQDFYNSNPDAWQSKIELSPVGQQLLDYQNAASLGLGQQTTNALGRVNQSLSKPFDYGSVQDVSDAAYAAQTARLDPQWAQQQQGIESQLVNQGLRPGTEAYDNAMRTFSQGKNDAYTQARMAAINTMPQTYQMSSALRNQPLNELNALRTGSQVTNPSFTNAPMQGQTSGADIMGAKNAQYAAQMQGYNSQQASDAAFNQGLMSLAGTAAMFAF